VLAAFCQSSGAFAQGTGQPAAAHELEAKTIVDHGEAPRGQECYGADLDEPLVVACDLGCALKRTLRAPLATFYF